MTVFKLNMKTLIPCKPIYSSVKFVGPVCKPICRVFKSFTQGYQPFRSTVLPVCSVPFPSHIPNICYNNASIQSLYSKFKTYTV